MIAVCLIRPTTWKNWPLYSIDPSINRDGDYLRRPRRVSRLLVALDGQQSDSGNSNDERAPRGPSCFFSESEVFLALRN